MQKIKLALEIAIKDLRSCYAEQGILTGSRGVYWSWDSFFASLGALAIGDYEQVKNNLSLYLSHQLENGNIPKRIAHPLYPLKYIGLPIHEKAANQKPSFQSPYLTGVSLSQCPVLIIAFKNYIDVARDSDFLKTNIKRLEKVFDFLEHHSYANGLLREPLGGGWAESVLKHGAIAYTNICYAKSLQDMSELESLVGDDIESRKFAKKCELLRQSIEDILWDNSRGGFYSDWRGFQRHHHFNADGNLLAVIWDIASAENQLKIDNQLDYILSKSALPLPLTSDKYNFWRIFLANRVGGIKDYHVAFSWIWLGCLAVLAKHKLGQKENALQILSQIAKQIVADKNVCEIYYKNRPVNVLFYKCERPWAWSAGMFVYTCSILGIRNPGSDASRL